MRIRSVRYAVTYQIGNSGTQLERTTALFAYLAPERIIMTACRTQRHQDGLGQTPLAASAIDAESIVNADPAISLGDRSGWTGFYAFQTFDAFV